jgi:hypothetical protein
VLLATSFNFASIIAFDSPFSLLLVIIAVTNSSAFSIGVLLLVVPDNSFNLSCAFI